MNKQFYWTYYINFGGEKKLILLWLKMILKFSYRPQGLINLCIKLQVKIPTIHYQKSSSVTL